MASSMVIKVACLAMMCIVLGVTLTHAVPTCGQVTSTVTPCVSYLIGSGSAVPAPCCNGVRTLNNQAKTTPDRQAVCRCLKPIAKNIGGLNPEKLASLPGKCGVNFPYKITASIDCNKYDQVRSLRT
ncbi:non-specific lipid-transfer protein 1-like [Gastrolobium bilobum]|uniref:non-specific lipid-transfer protein 1-like n=1 Tax=Gastrolobium bilobum TaxID=150636 RepID=UPI002AB1F71C|nr:non-specific lipid-transfer protein 1-like [Gastrolobium bilobum]